MMSKLFNTPFEISLRVIIILGEYEGAYLSADMIAATDFISIYGRTFEISTTNLHGDSPFKFSEFASRRNLVQQALKQLIADGFITVDCGKNGFTYSITENGLRYSDSFESNYADVLREMVHKTIKLINNLTEKDVLKMINKASIQSLKKGGK